MGDPLFDDQMRDIYVDAGVDIFELGIPTPDPFMDGPDVASAMERAMAGPTDPYDRLAGLASWLGEDIDRPAGVCMAYPDLAIDRIAQSVLDTLDGVLLVGPGSDQLLQHVTAGGARTCGLVPLGFGKKEALAATTFDGYVMMQSSPGVTGPRETLDARLADSITRLRDAGVSRPILAGFGIGTSAQARSALAAGADGVVIGSMCMRQALAGRNAIRNFLIGIRNALDA